MPILKDKNHKLYPIYYSAIDYLFLMSRKEMDEKATDPKNGKAIWEVSDSLRKRMGFGF